jgi:hypothetical protein
MFTYEDILLTIATTGELQRLQNLDSTDHTVEQFMQVYGIGKSKALQFVMQGFRTLEDLLQKGNLTESQRIGIELYDVLHFLILIDDRISAREFQGKK